TSERQQKIAAINGTTVDVNEIPRSDLKPSTFGCHVLIHALHNYIWETRQRYHNKGRASEEADTMHRHVEPALKAWQMAWMRSSREAGDVFAGLDQLSADSIPLLDMAQLRI